MYCRFICIGLQLRHFYASRCKVKKNQKELQVFLLKNSYTLSLAVEPLYPQVCQQVPVVSPTTQGSTLSPVELSRRLNSIPCGLSFHRDELPSLLPLVLEARHVGFCLRNVLQMWAASIASLSSVQLGAALFFLPPIFTVGQVLWFSCLIIPLLSTSLMGAPTDPTVMNVATGKNSRKIDKGVLTVIWHCP